MKPTRTPTRKASAAAKPERSAEDRTKALLDALRADRNLAPVVSAYERQVAQSGRKFGKNGLKTKGGKLFALFTQDTLVVKLPSERVAALVSEGVGKHFPSWPRPPHEGMADRDEREGVVGQAGQGSARVREGVEALGATAPSQTRAGTSKPVPSSNTSMPPTAGCRAQPGEFAPVIDRARCEGKATCAEVCPFHVFEVRRMEDGDFAQLGILGKLKSIAHGRKTAYTPSASACQACGKCVEACPEKAIKLARSAPAP